MKVRLKLPDAQSLVRLLIGWLCCGLAATFLLWTTLSAPGELQQIPVGLGRYFYFFPFGMAVGAALVILLWLVAADDYLAGISLNAALIYLGVLKTLGWTPVPWIALGAGVVGFISRRTIRQELRWTMLLLHIMGSLAGIYLAFQLARMLGPWRLFGETIRSLWLLAFG